MRRKYQFFLLCKGVTSVCLLTAGETEVCRELLDSARARDRRGIEKSCGELDLHFRETENAIAECRKFLETFIAEINLQYGMKLTVEEAVQMIRENADKLPIAPDMRVPLMMLVDSVEGLQIEAQELPVGYIQWRGYWPWQWNWFGLNKKEKPVKQSPVAAEISPDEMRGVLYVIVGTLLHLIPWKVTQRVGTELILMGTALLGDKVGQPTVYSFDLSARIPPR